VTITSDPEANIFSVLALVLSATGKWSLPLRNSEKHCEDMNYESSW